MWTDDAPGGDVRAVPIHTNFGYRLGERLLMEGNPGYTHNGVAAPPGLFFSYGINARGVQNPAPPSRGIGASYYSPTQDSMGTSGLQWVHRFADVKRPSEFIMIADTTANGLYDFDIVSDAYGGPLNESTATPSTIHRGGANVLFADGHVKWYLKKDLVTNRTANPSDVDKQRMWNADNKPFQN